MNAAWKIIGAVILFFGAILLVFAYRDVVPFFTDSPAERMASLWKRDMITLIGNKSLPDGFGRLKEFKVNAVSENTKAWIKEIEVPLATKPNGDHRLEILIDDWKDGADYGVMIQYELFEIASGNKVFEIGRTLTLGTNQP